MLYRLLAYPLRRHKAKGFFCPPQTLLLGYKQGKFWHWLIIPMAYLISVKCPSNLPQSQYINWALYLALKIASLKLHRPGILLRLISYIIAYLCLELLSSVPLKSLSHLNDRLLLLLALLLTYLCPSETQRVKAKANPGYTLVNQYHVFIASNTVWLPCKAFAPLCDNYTKRKA